MAAHYIFMIFGKAAQFLWPRRAVYGTWCTDRVWRLLPARTAT